MKLNRSRIYFTVRALMATMLSSLMYISSALADPLPSWNEGKTKRQLLHFIDSTTKTSSPDYVSVDKRIAAIDNDGTLWAEKPTYPQVAFLLDFIQSSQNRELIEARYFDDSVIMALAANDLSVLQGLNKTQLFETLTKPLSKMSVKNYQQAVNDYLHSADNSKYQRPHSEMLYQPLVELIRYLEAKEFTIYIVTGGGEDFVKSISQQFYQIPPQRVIGSKTKNSNEAGVEIKGYKIDGNLNENENKVQNIASAIGQIPLISIGNSDGDLQMLQSTQNNHGLSILISHTDGKREFSYSKASSLVDKIQPNENWMIVDMKKDFKQIFVQRQSM